MAALFLLVPLGLGLLVMRTRRWRTRRRWFWAGEKPLWFRDAMDRLPPPFGDYPPPKRRRR